MGNNKKTGCGCNKGSEETVVVAQVSPTIKQTSSSCKCSKVHTYAPTCQACAEPVSCSCSACSACKSACNPCEPSACVPVPISQPASGCKPSDLFALIDQPFTYPEIGFSAQTQISNVVLALGQPISHFNLYGTLFVSSVLNVECGIYELENRGTANNPENLVGRPVPCGTQFFIGAVGTGGTIAPAAGCNQLLADFHIPAVGLTSPAVVESFAGFSIGNQVIIRNKLNPSQAFTYTLQSTSGTNTLILQNDGQGGNPGDVLNADDGCDQSLDWCVEPLTDASICEMATPTQCVKSLLGCDENGNLVALTGTTENEAPAYDPECGGYVNKQIPEVTQCVLLETCFQIAPIVDICDRQEVIFTTSDDDLLLQLAEEALLSEFAQPKILICDQEFTLSLSLSVPGALVALPNFNPTEVQYFDENCSVCVPEDCCVQCNPQVMYPIEDFGAPGENRGGTFSIPYTAIQAVQEYKLSLVFHPTLGTPITFVHDNATNAITAAYDELGGPIVLGTLPGDINDYLYTEVEQCVLEDTCPLVFTFIENLQLDVLQLPANTFMNFKHESTFSVIDCDDPTIVYESTQMGFLEFIAGPTVTTLISAGTDPWGAILPDPTAKTYQSTYNSGQRSLNVSWGRCARVAVIPRILLNVTFDPGAVGILSFLVNTTSYIQTENI